MDRKIMDHYEKLTDHTDRAIYVKLVEKRRNFLHTESMVFAYSLRPKNILQNRMVGIDRVVTIRHLRKYGSVFYTNVEEFEIFNSKLNSYLSEFVTMKDERKSELFGVTT